MGIITMMNSPHFLQFSITFLHYFLYVTCQDCGCPPSPSPSSEPPALIFLDLRLAVVYPIIQTFKNTITSDPFNVTSTWVGPDICNYKGFYCDNPPDNVTATALAAIDFNGFQLAAPSLDGFIDRLPDLAIFHANTNNFTGTISLKIAQLVYFYELDISNNNFSGEFPMVVLGITGLTFLDVRYNSFTGSLPPQVFVRALNILFLNNNNFMQKLPDNLGSTPVLYLTLANNKFTGPIPRSIGNLSSTLIEVLFLGNLLTGCLPYEIGFLRKVTVFDVGNNHLTGPLPCSLGCLEKAQLLNFAGNFFYGLVPEVLCGLTNLVNLSLSDNYFTSVGPLCKKLINNGVLDVRKNCIYGLPYQRSHVECSYFIHFQAQHCPFFSMYDHIPCQLAPVMYPPPPPPMRPKRRWPPVTYSALTRHRL